MLTFRKSITCLKKSFEATVAFVQRPEAEVGNWEEAKLGLRSYIKSFLSLWGNWLGFLMCFCFMLLGKRILLDFFNFCVSTFLMLRTLLPEVSSIVPFCVRE